MNNGILLVSLVAFWGCASDTPQTPSPEASTDESSPDTSTDETSPDASADESSPDASTDGSSTDSTALSDFCSEIRIRVEEGVEVLPSTVLHLSAETGAVGLEGETDSASEETPIGFEWRINQPAGSTSVFSPSAYVQSPAFEANVIGTYTFSVTVRTERGACPTVDYVVTVTGPETIVVELSFVTPLASNETDPVFADVDLHLLHPRATGYFDSTYDAHWENPNPEWGWFGAMDNPRWSGGPGHFESVVIDVAEQNTTYEVGVHYRDAAGLGDAVATVSVYIYGVLRDRFEGVRLTGYDLWRTHTIAWPSGVVTRLTEEDGTPWITEGPAGGAF